MWIIFSFTASSEWEVCGSLFKKEGQYIFLILPPSKFSYLPKALKFEVLAGWPNQRDVQFDWAVQIRGTKVKTWNDTFPSERDGLRCLDIIKYSSLWKKSIDSSSISWSKLRKSSLLPTKMSRSSFSPLSSLVHNIISYIDRWTNQVSLCKYCSMTQRTCYDQKLTVIIHSFEHTNWFLPGIPPWFFFMLIVDFCQAFSQRFSIFRVE